MPVKPKKIPHTLSHEDFRKILLTIIIKDNKNYSRTKRARFRKIRDCMMFFLMFHLGLRPKEVYHMRMKNINFSTQTIFIPAEDNKQRQSDIMPIPDYIFDRFYAYIELRKRFFEDYEWVFPTKCRGKIKHINQSHLSKIFRLALKEAGLYHISYKDKQGLNRSNINLYSLRHSFGTRVYEKTHDLKKTALLLRHNDWQMRSTIRYIHTTQEKTRKDIFEEIFEENL